MLPAGKVNGEAQSSLLDLELRLPRFPHDLPARSFYLLTRVALFVENCSVFAEPSRQGIEEALCRDLGSMLLDEERRPKSIDGQPWEAIGVGVHEAVAGEVIVELGGELPPALDCGVEEPKSV